MTILPYRKFTFNTLLPVTEVRKRLDRITLNFPTSEHRYDGNVGENSFKISRRINYRNSFLPVIIGEITPTGVGSIVSVRIRLNWFAIVAAIVAYSILTYLIVSSFRHPELYKDAILPVVLLFVFTLLFIIPFALEANVAKKDLTKLFETKPD